MTEQDHLFMAEAIGEARRAGLVGEVPIGAVVVKDGEIIARGHNLRESGADPTAHAEMLAIKEASKRLGAWRLTDTTLYVTLEPCPMCMGAILQARITRLVFGPLDPKAGACGSLYDLSNDARLNHAVEVTSGIMEDESANLLKDFFRLLRSKDKGEKNVF